MDIKFIVIINTVWLYIKYYKRKRERVREGKVGGSERVRETVEINCNIVIIVLWIGIPSGHPNTKLLRTYSFIVILQY